MSRHERLPAARSQIKNRILLALPEHEFRRILPHLSLVGMRLGQILYDGDSWIDYAYFMNSGMASLIAVTADGETAEIGPVGNEGVMGIQAVSGGDMMFYSGVVQIPGNAMRIRSETLRYELQHNPGLSRLMREYTHDLRLHVSQSAACNRSHSLEQRLCRWLLTSQDCACSDKFPVTHKFLSHVVGACSAPLTLTTESLQEAGLISCQRSYIRIIDRPGIEARTCGCYRTLATGCAGLSAA